MIEIVDLVVIKREYGHIDKFLFCSEHQKHINGSLYHDVIDLQNFDKFKFNHFSNCNNDGNCKCIEATVIGKTIKTFKHKK